MKIRQRRFDLDLKPKTKKLNISFLIKIGAIAAAIIVSICLINYGVEVSNIRSSYLAGKESITVGIRTDVPAFGSIDDMGNASGFDKDVTETLLTNIFGEDVIIEYSELWSENAGAALKYDQVDIACGFIVPGTDKTSGFVTTEPYFDDHAVIISTGGITQPSELEGKTVGIMNSMINVAVMEEYLSSQGIEVKEILRYYDYASAKSDLALSDTDAFILPKTLAESYFKDGFKISDEPLFKVSYSLLFPPGETGIADVFSSEISKLKNSEKMLETAEKWHLAD